MQKIERFHCFNIGIVGPLNPLQKFEGELFIDEFFGCTPMTGLETRQPTLRIDTSAPPVTFPFVGRRVPDIIFLMNAKLSDYVIQRLDYQDRKMESIEKKVDSLLKFKWQVVGGGIALSAFITFAFQTIQFFSHK